MALDKILNLIFRIKGAKKAEQDVSKVDNKLVALGKTAIKVGGALFAAKGLVSGFNAISASAQSAQRVEDLESAMLNLGKNVGFGADSLEKFREATNGTVTDTELLTNANNALLLGIADSDNQMAQLFDTAQRLGKAMGVDTQFAVQSLTTGLGRQSKMILDNLGIMVDATSAQENLANELDKTVSQLTEEERKRAFINEAMRQAKIAVKELGEEQLGLNEKQEQFDVAITNLSNALGEKFKPAVESATTLFTNFINSVTGFLKDKPEKDFEGLTEEQIRLTKAIDGNTKASIRNSFGEEKQIGLKKQLHQANIDANEIGKKEIINQMMLESAMEDTSEGIEELTNRELIAIESFDVMRTTIDAGVESFKKLDDVVESNDSSIKLLSDNQQLAIMGVERFGGAIAQAAIHGQNMGDAITSSLKSIAAELVSKAATFAMLNLFTGGSLMAAQGGAGFGGFLLRGFTGQTPSVNVNIKGGLVSQSYVKNTLVPALNNARALG